MILVTGGSGFLGAHLLLQLTALDIKIIATKRETSNLNYVKKVFELAGCFHQFEKIEWRTVDFLDIYQLEDSLTGVEHVYHCASEVSFNPKDFKAMIENNVKITANVVNAALYKGVKKLMHVSSIAALGRSTQEEIIDETRIWKTDPVNSKYGFSKYKSEMEVWRAYEEGLPVIIVNPAVILGYCNWNEGTGKMFERSFTGMNYFTNGYTGWVDVKDVATCMILLMQKNINGERFILSSDTREFKWLFESIAEHLSKPKAKKEVNMSIVKWLIIAEKWRSKITGRAPMITKETMRNATLKCNYINDKVKTELGFEFKPVEVTIKETATLFLEEKKGTI